MLYILLISFYQETHINSVWNIPVEK